MSAIEQPTTPRKRVPLSSILDPSNTQQGLPTPFTTPRRRKQPPQLPSTPPPEEPWPRLGAKIPLETLKQVTRELFGYEPRQWQLDVFTKIAEGYDGIAIAGTGYGKSLVFVLLAIAAVLARKGGMVLVISPLKALEKDQVRRFCTTRSIQIDGVVREIRVAAVAINEDNNDTHVFKRLENGEYDLVYASPECLLRNQAFKQAFRREDFRSRMVAAVVDEAHVIQAWKDDFRKDYGELMSLRIIMGTEIPWLALTATASTKTFETIYSTLRMGQERPFYGIDLGSDRPNLAQWVRPMEYSATSLHDLFAFIPISPTSPRDFNKSIFYFKTRQEARQACRKIRLVLPLQFRTLVYPFTAMGSEDYKEQVMEGFRKGTIRILCATIAAGMGTDIPDIVDVVIFGVDSLHDAYQKGGRAGRSANVGARMIWIVEKWAFELEETNGKATKKNMDDERRRFAMDPAAREYINRSMSEKCMREYIVTYFRPRPNLPGFPYYSSDEKDREPPPYDVEWLVVEQEIAQGSDCGCSAKCCRIAPSTPVGQLTSHDHSNIAQHALTLQTATSGSSHPASPPLLNSSPLVNNNQPMLRCSKLEKESLREALEMWRDTSWALIRHKNPFLSREWILTLGDINKLVDKFHVFLNATEIDEGLLESVVPWMGPDEVLESLLSLLSMFKQDCLRRSQQDISKRVAMGLGVHSSNAEGEDSGVHKDESPATMSLELQWQLPICIPAKDDPFMAGFSSTLEWQIPNYSNDF